MTFEGKVAIVTGGGQGLGKACCLALLNEGVKVCICDINEDTSAELIKSLPESLQRKIIFKKCDVTDYNNLKDAFDETMNKFGRIDIVVNNAGVAGESTWKRTIETNFVGVLHGIQLGLQYMSLENGGQGGFIINTASKAGFEAGPLFPVYCATKHAVVGFTKSYGSEYHFKKTGIKVNAICPGGVNTPMLKNFASNSLDEKLVAEIIKNHLFLEADVIGQALIKMLYDGKTGSLLRIDSSGMKYV